MKNILSDRNIFLASLSGFTYLLLRGRQRKFDLFLQFTVTGAHGVAGELVVERAMEAR